MGSMQYMGPYSDWYKFWKFMLMRKNFKKCWAAQKFKVNIKIKINSNPQG